LTPTFTDLVAKDDNSRRESLFFMYSKLIAIMATPLSLTLILMARPIINFWVGEEFMLASNILPIHVVPLLITIPLAASGCLTNAYAKVKIPSRVSFAVALFNIIFVVVLGRIFGLGLFGVAIASAVSIFFFSAVFEALYACKISNFSYQKLLWESFIKPVICALIIIGGCFWLIKVVYSAFPLTLPFVAIFSFSIFIYYVVAYIFVLNRSEQKNIDEIIKSFFDNLKRFQNLNIRKVASKF
jgi:O-antigen/teichoic acid export membrane protein